MLKHLSDMDKKTSIILQTKYDSMLYMYLRVRCLEFSVHLFAKEDKANFTGFLVTGVEDVDSFLKGLPNKLVCSHTDITGVEFVMPVDTHYMAKTYCYTRKDMPIEYYELLIDIHINKNRRMLQGNIIVFKQLPGVTNLHRLQTTITGIYLHNRDYEFTMCNLDTDIGKFYGVIVKDANVETLEALIKDISEISEVYADGIIHYEDTYSFYKSKGGVLLIYIAEIIESIPLYGDYLKTFIVKNHRNKSIDSSNAFIRTYWRQHA